MTNHDRESESTLSTLASLPQGVRKTLVGDSVLATLEKLPQSERDVIEIIYRQFTSGFKAKSTWPMDSEMVLEIIAKLAWYIGV